MNRATKKVPKLLEIIRFILAFVGFIIAYQMPAKEGVIWLVGLVVLPLTGLTAIESLFFAKSAASIKGRIADSYQMQSGLNNLATAVTAVVVLIFNFNLQAQITICLVALIFFALSSINHAREYFFAKKSTIHLQRLILTIVLWAGCLPLIIRSS